MEWGRWSSTSLEPLRVGETRPHQEGVDLAWCGWAAWALSALRGSPTRLCCWPDHYPMWRRLWRGGRGWEPDTQVSIGTGGLGLARCWGRPGCPSQQRGEGRSQLNGCRQRPLLLSCTLWNRLQASWGKTIGLRETCAWQWSFKATMKPLQRETGSAPHFSTAGSRVSSPFRLSSLRLLGNWLDACSVD